MRLKGIFEQKSLATKLGLLFGLIVVSVILHTFFAYLCIELFFDVSLISIGLLDLTTTEEINAAKLLQLFSAVGLFISPTLLYAYLTTFDFKLGTLFSRQALLLAVVIMLVINPFIAFIYEWNMSLDLPKWLLKYDEKAEVLTALFMQMSAPWDLIFNLLVIAIVPAVGEELLFRGYLQQSFSKWFKNPHLGIVIAAVLFSAIHMQFQGFFPRFILGIVLGYLFYWSGSLWLPIIAHLLNNAVAVIFSYPSMSSYASLVEDTATWQEAFFSFMGVALLMLMLQKNLSIKKD